LTDTLGVSPKRERETDTVAKKEGYTGPQEAGRFFKHGTSYGKLKIVPINLGNPF
jgi:hypothetical protein